MKGNGILFFWNVICIEWGGEILTIYKNPLNWKKVQPSVEANIFSILTLVEMRISNRFNPRRTNLPLIGVVCWFSNFLMISGKYWETRLISLQISGISGFLIVKFNTKMFHSIDNWYLYLIWIKTSSHHWTGCTPQGVIG